MPAENPPDMAIPLLDMRELDLNSEKPAPVVLSNPPALVAAPGTSCRQLSRIILRASGELTSIDVAWYWA